MEDDFNLADCFSDYQSTQEYESSDETSSMGYTVIEDYIDFGYVKYNLDIRVTSEYDDNNNIVTNYHVIHNIYNAISSVEFINEDAVKYEDILNSMLTDLDLTDLIKININTYNRCYEDEKQRDIAVMVIKTCVQFLALRYRN